MRKVFYDLPKIERVSCSDPSFNILLDTIKKETGVETISYTTGPKRGEIVWRI